MSWPNTVRKSDLKIDYYRASGPGGQHRNKTSSACRITHIPTGIQAYCSIHREQHRNREEAFRLLANKLKPLMIPPALDTQDKNSLIRIRTYNEHRGDVIDHINNLKYNYQSTVFGDELDVIIENSIKANKNV